MHCSRRVLSTTAAALLMLAVAAGGAHAGKGNSAAAEHCKKGGWTGLKASTGASFANPGACVAYAAKGGALSPTASFAFELGTCHPAQFALMSCPDATLVGSGLQPGGIVYRCDGGLPPDHPDAFCYPQFEIAADGTLDANNWGDSFECVPGEVYSYNAPTAAGPLVITSDSC